MQKPNIERMGAAALRRLIATLPDPTTETRMPLTSEDAEHNELVYQAKAAAKRLQELEHRAAGLEDAKGWTIERTRAYLESWQKKREAHQRDRERLAQAQAAALNNPRLRANLEPVADVPALLPQEIRLRSQLHEFLGHVARLVSESGPLRAVAQTFTAQREQLEQEKQARGLDLSDSAQRWRILNPDDTFAEPHPGSLTHYLEAGHEDALAAVDGIRGPESFAEWLGWFATDAKRSDELAAVWPAVLLEAVYREWLSEGINGELRLAHTGEPFAPPFAVSKALGAANVSKARGKASAVR